jgi:hypothetical protein
MLSASDFDRRGLREGRRRRGKRRQRQRGGSDELHFLHRTILPELSVRVFAPLDCGDSYLGGLFAVFAVYLPEVSVNPLSPDPATLAAVRGSIRDKAVTRDERAAKAKPKSWKLTAAAGMRPGRRKRAIARSSEPRPHAADRRG